MPLLTINTLPPGGWIFQQIKDGLPFKNFSSMGPFADFCKGILAVRSANLLPGASLGEVESEVQDFTCNRLGNDPRWCGRGSGVVTQPSSETFHAVVPVGGGCGGCAGSKIA